MVDSWSMELILIRYVDAVYSGISLKNYCLFTIKFINQYMCSYGGVRSLIP
jgi:hypothetical protein